MPSGILPAIVGVAVLVLVVSGLDWLIANPGVLLFIVLAIGGWVFFRMRQKRARNRV